MSRSRSLLLSCALVAGALVPAAAAGAAPSDNANDRARAEHERIVAYWTPERMRAAQPRDFVRQADGSFSLATPKGKPGGDGNKGKPSPDPTPTPDPSPSPTGIPVTTGSSWTAGGDVLKRSGKVYFRMGGGGYICSGSVLDDGGSADFSLVLTAGHCAYDETVTDGTGFATDWLFIPDFDSGPYLDRTGCNSSTTLGCWTAKRLVVHDGFASAGGFNDQATRHDFAVAVVGLGGHADSSGALSDLDRVVGGSYRLRTGGASTDRLSAFGYPAEGKYKGNDLMFCSGMLISDGVSSLDPWGMACKMNGGSSGGPWILTNPGPTSDDDADTLEADGSGGVVGSLNSYGYTGLQYMFGPVFNADTTAVHAEALNGLAGGNVAVTTPKPQPSP